MCFLFHIASPLISFSGQKPLASLFPHTSSPVHQQILLLCLQNMLWIWPSPPVPSLSSNHFLVHCSSLLNLSPYSHSCLSIVTSVFLMQVRSRHSPLQNPLNGFSYNKIESSYYGMQDLVPLGLSNFIFCHPPHTQFHLVSLFPSTFVLLLFLEHTKLIPIYEPFQLPKRPFPKMST